MVSLTLEAPEIARKIQPGQFVVIRVNEGGERIPLTVAHKDAANGTITIIIQIVGKSSALLASLRVGDAVKDLCGPLGVPAPITRVGTVVGIGGGSGIAVLYHVLSGHHAAGNRIIGIIGARERDLLIMEEEMRAICDELLVTTDDGGYGMHGKVTDALQSLVERQERIDRVIAVGPLVMMRAVTEMTRIYRLPTEVSLNPIMVDGTGMCGGCRCTVGGKTQFACVDGPHFDAFDVDFEELIQRGRMYERDERTSLLTSIKAR
jgi:ferredoxin--NADP+ reductase